MVCSKAVDPFHNKKHVVFHTCMVTICSCAQVGCELEVVSEEFSPFTATIYDSGCSLKLGLHGSFQKKNAAIAVAMCRDLDMHVSKSTAPVELSDESVRLQATRRTHELKKGKLPEEYLRGLEHCRFPGRAQIAQVPVAALPRSPSESSGA